MAMEGTLKNRNGKLYVLYAYDEFSEPFRQFIWYPVLQTRGSGYGDRPEDGDVAMSSGGGEWKTHRPLTHRATGSVSTGSGSTQAESVERVSLNPPSTGGKELRWHDGRWEKLMVRGWVPAGEGGKTKGKKATHATVRVSGSYTKATLKALDAINYGERVALATRQRLVREGLVTHEGRLTDRGQDAVDRRLAHEVLGRDHASTRHHATKKSPAQLDAEIAEILSRYPYDDPSLRQKWMIDPSDLRVGLRFDYFGTPFEIVKIGRDKDKTIQIAVRHKTSSGKEGFFEHKSFPLRALYQQHLRPLR